MKFSFGKLKASLHFPENDNRRISASRPDRARGGAETILHLVGSDFAEPLNQFLDEPDFHRTIPNVCGQVPLGLRPNLKSNGPLALSSSGFTSLGPKPLQMTGCSGCYDYTKTEGRVNTIAVDPTTTTNGSIVAYLGSVGGGVWKTTN